MKNRTIPYGYKMVSGKYFINDTESKIVQQIFNEYLDGTSLKNIAENLKKKKVEYLPDQYNWNKNRIQRLLTDQRYIGTDIFDEIVEKNQFENTQTQIQSRNLHINFDPTKTFTCTIIPILCGKCKQPAIRNCDSRRKNKLLHKCSNPECKSVYIISDDNLWKLVTEGLSQINIEPDIQENKSVTMEIRRLENEIARDFDNLDLDYNNLKNKIFQSAALKYQAIRTETSESEIFVKAKTRSQLSIKEIQNLASKIYLIDNQHIQIQLINGQMTGKEKEYDTGNTNSTY